jgi:L-malate glycosyltransferase
VRLLYVANGESIHTQRWVRYFAQHGHDVHLATPTPPAPGALPDVHVHRLETRVTRPRAIRRLRRLVLLRRLVPSIRPALVHAHYLTGYGDYAALCGFRPFLLTAWGSDVLVDPSRGVLRRWQTRFALRRAARITCDAEHMAVRLGELGAPAERISIVKFGTDVEQFRPRRHDAAWRAELGLPPQAPVVISTRSLNPIYDVESLVRALPLVRREVPAACAVILGDGSLRASLERLALVLGVADAVRFVGQIEPAAMPRWLASADVYASTSLSDGGLAASTAEAMASGLPVVVTDFGDNDRWVADGAGGFLVPLRDPAALAGRLVLLLRDAPMRRRFGRYNRSVIEERDNHAREMAAMGAIYEEVVREAHS